MPRYLVETVPVGDVRVDAAVRLAELRFPEIAVEHHYTTRDGSAARAVWVCRAPSDAHLHRWATAAQLPVSCVRHVDAHELNPIGRPRPGEANR